MNSVGAGPEFRMRELRKPEDAINLRRKAMRKMWEDGVPAHQIMKALGINRQVFIRTASDLKLPSRGSRETAREEQVKIQDFVAKHGVSTQPNFGDPEVNDLYIPLKERGYTLVGSSLNKSWRIVPESQFRFRDSLLKRARHIIANELPFAFFRAKTHNK